MNFTKNEDKTGLLLFIISLVFLGFTTYIAFTKLGMWFDEIVSYEMMRFSFADIVTRTSGDVHPPLYYFIYKFFSKIAILIGFNNTIIVGKFTSLLPFYLLFIVSFFKIRKNFGWLTTGLFTLTLICMPQMMNFAVELRMYSWGLFFITTSFIFIYDILNNKSTTLNWVILTILTIASTYTHYFAAMASIILYIFLLIIFLKNNNKYELKKWFISTIVAIVAYIPQVLTVINQVNSVNGNYWIESVTFNRFIGYIFFVFSPKNEIISANEIPEFTILGFLLLCAVLIIIYLAIKNKKDFKTKFAIYGFIIAIALPLLGIFISILMSPIFHPRYMIPVLGIFWLCVSILLAKNFNKKIIFIPVLVIILICSLVGSYSFLSNQYYEEAADFDFTQELTNNLGLDNVIICDSISVYIELYSYYLPTGHCYYMEVDDKSHDDAISKINNILSYSDVKSAIDDGHHVYFLRTIKEYDKDFAQDYENFTLVEKDFTFGKTIMYEVIPKN